MPIDRSPQLARDAAGIETWAWEAGASRQARSLRQHRLYGIDPAGPTPPAFEEQHTLLVPEDRAIIPANLARCEREREYNWKFDFRTGWADIGDIHWLLALGTVIEADEHGGISRIPGVNPDFTDWWGREETIKANETRLRLASKAAGVPARERDMATRALVYSDDAPSVEAALRQAIAGGTTDYCATTCMFKADGTIRWTKRRGPVIRDGSGWALRLIGINYDITARKAVMHAVLEQQSDLRQCIERASVALAMFDIEMRCRALRIRTGIVASIDAPTVQPAMTMRGQRSPPSPPFISPRVLRRRFIKDFGLPATARGNLLGRRLEDVLSERPEAGISIPQSVLTGETRHQDDDTYVRLDKTRESVRWSMASWVCADGAVSRARLAIQATPTPGETEAALAETEAKLRAPADLLPRLNYPYSADGSDGWLGLLHPNDRAASVGAWNHTIRLGGAFERERRLCEKDCEYRWFLSRATPRREKADGPNSRWLGNAPEVSEIAGVSEAAARAAADLEVRVAERSRTLEDTSAELHAGARLRGDLQAALVQSQKLEALGHLTAGVAHDFNNVLAAIQASFEIIARQVTGQPVARIVEAGMEATKQAISLTRQLVDFARTRSLEPTVVDVAVSIRQANKMIGHAVGPGIDRLLAIQPGVWPVLTDGDQLKVALLNLAINAKDAMPDGGQLVLEARNLDPGERPPALPFNEYVCISVRDTGHGMPPDVVMRATETFFTTKPPGKGTGLGLPMVHAFASRSGGMLRIDSQEGSGTTVTLILPRAAVGCMKTPHGDSALSGAGSAVEGGCSARDTLQNNRID
jgi:signal transduction histidine kinase